MNPEIKPLNVLIKGLLLFILFNLVIAAWQPGVRQFSLYNVLYPGRERLPFGENPKQSYNLSLFDLDAMFASHVITGKPKADDEFRVIIVRDSSVWGTLLKPDETLAGQLNADNLNACGKNVRVYNLGYPTISLTKDVMLLSYGMQYDPNLVIWMTTLVLLERFQVNALIIAYFVGLLTKDFVAYFVNDKLCFPQKFYFWQSLGAPLLAAGTHYLLMDRFSALIWQGDQITSIIIFFVGILPSLFVFMFLYGIFGGWDDATLAVFVDAAAMTGPLRGVVTWLMVKPSIMSAKLSPLHGRFAITIRAAAMDEARSLTAEKVKL